MPIRRAALLALALLPAAPALAGDPVVFDNGTFITGVGTGTGGTDVSVAEPAPGVIGLSFNAALASPAHVVDDFVITNAPAGGQPLSRLHFYGFQTTTGGVTNVQFSAAYVTLYDADPALGGVPIAGDFTTNRLTSTTFTGAYRLSSSGSFSNARPIQRLAIDMSWAPSLANGTYWLAVSARGDFSLSASANPFAFFVTPRPAVNNGYQFFNGTYFSTFEYPFTLFGPTTPACPADFDNSGTRDVSDIFAFLSAWFASGPGSDFDNSGTRDVSDIFAFLSAWFAGCP